MATQTEIGRHLDLSQGAVSQLLADLGMDRGSGGYELDAVRVAYIRRLRERAAGRTGEDAKLNLAEERAKLAVLQTEAMEIKNQKSLGELLPRDAVTSAMQDANAKVRARYLALPPRAAPIIAPMNSPVEIQAYLTDLVHEALAELATTRIITGGTEGGQHGPGNGGDAPGGGAGCARMVDGVRPAAQADGKPVGRRKQGAERRGKRGNRKVVDSPR